MTNAESHDDFCQVVREVCEWGEMKAFEDHQIGSIAASIRLLDDLRDGKDVSLRDLFIDRVASVTKVYEMHDPHSWMIYDSRVARGLAYLVRVWWEGIGNERREDLLRFPWPPG